jgi:soluble lytic murein transglycosylase
MKIRTLFVFLTLLLPLNSAFADSAPDAFRYADSKQWSEASFAARQTGNALLQEFIQWRKLKDSETRADANEIMGFIETHPDWPDVAILLDRAEESIALEGAQESQVRRWMQLKGNSRSDATSYLVKQVWKCGELNTAEQENLLRAFPSYIGQEEIITRVNKLLWEDMANRAKPLIPLIPARLRKIAYARIALQTNQFGIEKLLADMPAQYRNDSSVLYERMRWRARKQLDSGVREILLQAPMKVAYPAKWWPYRVHQVREAIQDGQYDTALRLLQNHGQTGDVELADALWLRGWILLTRKNDANAAYKDFYDLYHHVNFPVSLSRGAYWAGLAAQKNNNRDIAQNWFKEAAKYPSTFYGQLASIELGATHLSLPDSQSNASKNFSSSQQRMVDLVRLLARYDQKLSVEKFMFHLASIQKRHYGNLHSLGRLAQEIAMPHLTVRTGKAAMQTQRLWLGKTSHPVIDASNLAVETALALAITRQESEFNPQARSSANAMGMMQLLPGTAQQMARKWGAPYSQAQLMMPRYNMELGSAYLAGLLDKWNGSYPLAIASYNAGPGNVNKWVAQMGYPPSDTIGMLNWIERIPFAETRNYVQRVLENLQVYRTLLGAKEPLTKQRMLGK